MSERKRKPGDFGAERSEGDWVYIRAVRFGFVSAAKTRRSAITTLELPSNGDSVRRRREHSKWWAPMLRPSRGLVI